MDSKARERRYLETVAREARKADAAYRRAEKQMNLAAGEQQRYAAVVRSAELSKRAAAASQRAAVSDAQRAATRAAKRIAKLQKEVARSEKQLVQAAKRAESAARKAVAEERKKRPLLPPPSAEEVRERWEERERREAS